METVHIHINVNMSYFCSWTFFGRRKMSMILSTVSYGVSDKCK